jgi:hypothetical protein
MKLNQVHTRYTLARGRTVLRWDRSWAWRSDSPGLPSLTVAMAPVNWRSSSFAAR